MNLPSSNYLDCDIRVKENVENSDLHESYSIIKDITLKKFNYCDCYECYNGCETIGVISQELKTICPNLVKEGYRIFKKSDGSEEVIPDFNVVDTQLLNLHLIGAVKKLVEKVESLENEITLLKNNI
jgi:hypothetical protein